MADAQILDLNAAIAVGLALGFQFVLIRKLKKGQSA